jgi:hypothetical protein
MEGNIEAVYEDQSPLSFRDRTRCATRRKNASFSSGTSFVSRMCLGSVKK